MIVWYYTSGIIDNLYQIDYSVIDKFQKIVTLFRRAAVWRMSKINKKNHGKNGRDWADHAFFNSMCDYPLEKSIG